MTQQQRGRRGLIILLAILALGIAGIDQATKYLAEDRLTPGVITPLVGDFLGLQLIYNPGAAFSLATGMTWVFTIVSIGVVVVVLRVSRKLRSTGWAVALGMLLGGAVGNLYDRLFREPGFARGHVVDFINYNGWFVGNIADIAIVVAAVLIALLALRGTEIDGTRATSGRSEDEEPVASRDDEALSEEPLADDDAFSAEVPSAADGDVDIADWVAGASATSQAPASRPAADEDADTAAADTDADAAGPNSPAAVDAPAEPGAEPATSSAAAEPGAEPATEPVPPVPARRPRSRREIRLAADDDA